MPLFCSAGFIGDLSNQLSTCRINVIAAGLANGTDKACLVQDIAKRMDAIVTRASVRRMRERIERNQIDLARNVRQQSDHLLGMLGLVGRLAGVTGLDMGTLLGMVGLVGRPADTAGFDKGTLLGIVGLDGRPMPTDKFGLGDVGRGDTGRTDMAGCGLWGSGGDAVGGLVGMRCPTGGCLLEGIAALGRI